MSALTESSKPLTELMRDRTKEPHDKSDHMVNLRLALVLTSSQLWAEAISLFYPIYEELDAVLKRNKDKGGYFQQLHSLLSEFEIANKMRDDIKFFLPKDEDFQVLKQRRKNNDGQYQPKELNDYISRIRQLEKDQSPAIISYFYHMNMALMAGGYFIKKAVKHAFSLKTDDGVRMFTFEDPARIRAQLKEIINGLSLNDHDREIILQESVRIFEQNNALVGIIKDSSVFRKATQEFTALLARWGATFLVVGIGALLASNLSRRST